MKNVGVGLGLFIGLFLLIPCVHSEGVAILLGRQVGPYMEALKSFQQSADFKFQIFEMEGDSQKGATMLQQIESGDFSAVVTIGTEATMLAKSAAGKIPVVYTMVLTPLEFQNHNASGIFIKIPVEKQFEYIQKLLPSRPRIGVVYGLQSSADDIATARKAADKLSLKVVPIGLDSPEQLPAALAKLTAASVDLIWMVADAMVSNPNATLLFARHCQAENLPLIGCSAFQIKAGALAVFSADFQDIGAQTEVLVKGVSNGKYSKRVEGPRKIIVILNKDAQKNFGINDLSVFPNVQFSQ